MFAAGIGSRLKPWTDFHPKALVEVGGRPVISYVIDKMLAAGIETIIINVHHFADQVMEYVRATYTAKEILFSDETDLLLDTGGGLRKVLDVIGDDDVFIHNADIFTNFDIDAIIRQHRESSADATLLTQYRDTQRYILFDSGRMCGWTNVATGQVRPVGMELKSQYEKRAFGGVHVVSSKVFDALKNYAPEGTPFSIMNFYIDTCQDIDIRSFDFPEGCVWFDIGKPETLKLAQEYYKSSH